MKHIVSYLESRSGGHHKILQMPNNDLEYVIASICDSYALTEHGGSVYGAWISDKGERFLKVFKEFLAAEEENNV